MANQYGRHYIVGDETDQPRPIVYLHPGWRHRRFRGARPRRAPALLMAGLMAAIAAIGLLAWLMRP